MNRCTQCGTITSDLKDLFECDEAMAARHPTHRLCSSCYPEQKFEPDAMACERCGFVMWGMGNLPMAWLRCGHGLVKWGHGDGQTTAWLCTGCAQGAVTK